MRQECSQGIFFKLKCYEEVYSFIYDGSCYDDIITEIADVMIMCEQLSYYFGKEKVELEKERKLERLKERLSKYTD